MALPRHDNDFYETHCLLTHKLLEQITIDPDHSMVEPCAGSGAISDLMPCWVITNDLFFADLQLTYEMDATRPEFWQEIKTNGGCDWVISNPPFKSALEIVEHALDHARVGVAMLLRLSFLEPTRDRKALWQKHCPALIMPISPRPRFRTDTKGSDSVTVAWFVWYPHEQVQSTKLVPITDWK